MIHDFNRKRIREIMIGITGIWLISSCVSTKNVTYFQDLSPAKRSELETVAKFTEPIIQPDDILSITINTTDPQSTAIVNQPSTTILTYGTFRQDITGFIVDKNGEIKITQLGTVKVGGLTTFEARERITKLARKELKDPAVSVRFANFKVSVLGEVNRPGSYNVSNEKVNILDVLSLAGDLTIYGKRENITVIRELNNKKEIGRLNLNTTDIFNNPFYYLKQNDIVYVEPNKAKVISVNAGARTTAAVLISAISTIVLIFTRLN